jgi:hypothetical protein
MVEPFKMVKTVGRIGTRTGPGFAVLYRWRLHPGMEESFVNAWSVNSEIFLSKCGSLGSRLHRGSDGIWYSYAQWPDAATRTKAFASAPLDAEASRQMRAAIAETLPEVALESVSDLLLPALVQISPAPSATLASWTH